MRPSSLGGGRILRRTLSVRLSVRPVIVAIGNVFSSTASVTDVLFGMHWGHPYFSARTDGIRTFRHALRAAYRTAISAAQILVLTLVLTLVCVCMCYVFWLFWLSCQYLPSDWLERPLWGSLTMARGSSQQSPGRRVLMIFMVYCIVSLFYDVFMLYHGPTWYISYSMARYSLFVLKVPLNTNEPDMNIGVIRAGLWALCRQMMLS